MSVEIENLSINDYSSPVHGVTTLDAAFPDAGVDFHVQDGADSAGASPLPSPSSDEGVVDSRPEVDQMAEFPELELDDSAVESEQQNHNNNNGDIDGVGYQNGLDNDRYHRHGEESEGGLKGDPAAKSQVWLQKRRIEQEENGNLTTTTTTTAKTTTNNIGKLLKSSSQGSNDESWIKQKPKEDLHSVKISVSDEMAALHAERHPNGATSPAEVKLWGPPPPTKEFVDAENQCYRCHDKIYPNDAIHGPLKGVFFHQKCFLCFECNRRLNLTSYFHSREDVKDARIFCGQHQPKAQGSGYGMDSLDFKGPKIETERVTANVFGGPQMAKGGTFDAQVGVGQGA